MPGRMRGGKDRHAPPPVDQPGCRRQLKPGTQQQDGTIVYSDFPSPGSRTRKDTALQLGTAYVAFASELPPRAPGRFRCTSATTLNAAVHTTSPSESPMDKALNWTCESTARLGDMLYATRCSTLNANCVTAFTSVSEAAHSEIRVIIASTAGGRPAGCLYRNGAFFLVPPQPGPGSATSPGRSARPSCRLFISRSSFSATRQIVGAEALARWTDEEGKTVDPEVFVKIAEENGFVGALTKSVLRHALRDFANILAEPSRVPAEHQRSRSRPGGSGVSAHAERIAERGQCTGRRAW